MDPPIFDHQKMCELEKDCNHRTINLSCCITGHATRHVLMKQTYLDDTKAPYNTWPVKKF